jgi:predicted type IV restriction endonuclease
MYTIPKKIEIRIQEGLKKYKRIIANAQKKDVNESDTVMIITDMLSEIFGFDKFDEITSEYAIRSTYCDLAVKIGAKVKYLIECKAVGVDLKDTHIRQAIDYGTKEGVDWVVLTNGVQWKVYKILFNRKPVVNELIYGFDISEMQARTTNDIEKLFALSREGMAKSKTALSEMYEHKSTVNKYMVGQLLLDDATVAHIKRLFRKLSPDIKVESDTLLKMLETEIIKRDVLDPELSAPHKRLIKRKLSPAKPKSTSALAKLGDGIEHVAEIVDEVIAPIEEI